MPFFLLITLLVCAFSACVKEKFDAPASSCSDPSGLVATHTLASFKSLYPVVASPVLITDDIVIAGIVNADDKSGNFYKQICMQDSTGGLSIKIDGYNLFSDFPVGRKIFIKCKGMYLGQYNGLIQLGAGLDNSSTPADLASIPASMIDKYIIKGSCNNTITPRILTVGSLVGNYQSMLIQINDMEFDIASLGTTQANAVLGTTVNHTLNNCSSGSILLRNSGYADFAVDTVPSGSGTITAIYQVFGTTSQLYIRNTGDLQFNNPRCGGGGGVVGGSFLSIAGVRALYSGGDAIMAAGSALRGVVISNRNGGTGANINNKNIVIQDSSGQGIVVRFAASHTFNVGDKVYVDISGTTLTSYNGLLQLDATPNAAATLVSSGNLITPSIKTVAELNADVTLQSTLVQINGVTITGAGTTFAGTCSISQGTNMINLYTATAAAFSTSPLPTGTVTSLVGIVGQFNSVQINMRTAADVTP